MMLKLFNRKRYRFRLAPTNTFGIHLISITVILFVLSSIVVVIEASTSSLSTSNDAQTLRSLGMSDSEIDALLGTSSNANSNDDDYNNMNSQNRNILGGSIMRNDDGGDEYDEYDTDGVYDQYGSIDSYEEEEALGNDFFIDGGDDEIQEESNEDTFEDTQIAQGETDILENENIDGDKDDTDILEFIDDSDTETYTQREENDILENIDQNSGDSNDNDEWWKDPFSKFDEQEDDNEDLFLSEEENEDDSIIVDAAEIDSDDEVDFLLEEDDDQEDNDQREDEKGFMVDEEEINDEGAILDMSESDQYKNDEEIFIDLSENEDVGENGDEIDDVAASQIGDISPPDDNVDELFNEYDNRPKNKADEISPFDVDYEENFYDEYDSDFREELELEKQLEADLDEFIVDEEEQKVEEKEEDVSFVEDEKLETERIEDDTLEAKRYEEVVGQDLAADLAEEQPTDKSSNGDEIITTSTPTFVRDIPKKKKKKMSSDMNKRVAAVKRKRKKEPIVAKTSILKKEGIDSSIPITPEASKETQTMSLPSQKEEEESKEDRPSKEIQSSPSTSQEQEGSDKSPTASVAIPLSLIPKLGLTLIQSPLTVQLFAGLTVANAAFHRFGGSFKKKKIEEKNTEETLYHQHQNDEDFYDSEDMDESGDEAGIVGGFGFGRPMPVQRKRSTQLMEEDETSFAEHEGRNSQKQMQKTPQKSNASGNKRIFWGEKEKKQNSEGSSRTVYEQEKEVVAVSSPREAARKRFGWRNNVKEEMEAQLNEIESLREKSAIAETARDKLEHDYDAVVQRLKEAQKQLNEVSRTNNFLKNQLRDNKRVLERAVSAERQKTNNELARVRDQMVAVLERERRIMRAQLMKSSEEVRSMIANKEFLDDYKYDYDYDHGEF